MCSSLLWHLAIKHKEAEVYVGGTVVGTWINVNSLAACAYVHIASLQGPGLELALVILS